MLPRRFIVPLLLPITFIYKKSLTSGVAGMRASMMMATIARVRCPMFFGRLA